MKTQIIGVLGLGIFGQTIATELSTFGQDVIALDNNPKTIDSLADQVTKAAVGDITDIDFLCSTGIESCDTVIIATGEHLESSALALLHCKKLGIKRIIAKAKNINYEEVLYGMGANLVITPERSTAKELASNILRYNISNVFHLEDDVALIELKIPHEWAGKSLNTLNLRKTYNVNVIGFRNDENGKLNTHFNPTKQLPNEGTILVVADNRTLEKFDYLGYLK